MSEYNLDDNLVHEMLLAESQMVKDLADVLFPKDKVARVLPAVQLVFPTWVAAGVFSDMEKKFRVLDLYCGGGGSAMGFHNAGFEVVGVDIYPQHLYPFEMVENDAVDYLERHWEEFDVINASPPCQSHSATRFFTGRADMHTTDMIPETREAILKTGLPYVIENVPQAPLIDPVTLCGWMEEIQEIYPLLVYRHRKFESNIPLVQPKHRKHPENVQRFSQRLEADRFVTIIGKFSGIEVGRRAMGIDWLSTRSMSQAIPPAYTEFIGHQVLEYLQKQSSQKL